MGRMRHKGTMIAVLVLLALTASVVLAANPLVDGNIAGDEGWQGIAPVQTDQTDPQQPNSDPDEWGPTTPPNIDNVYDIKNVYLRSSEDSSTLFLAFDVYDASTGIFMHEPGAWVYVGFDTDPSRPGGLTAPGSCPNIGAEYRLEYTYDGDEEVWQARLRYWDPDYVPQPKFRPLLSASVLTAFGPGWESAVQYADLGLTATDSVGIGIHFENAAVDPDDDVCFTWTPENGGGEGCTPGYWKQSQHFDSWVNPPYDPETSLFDAAFGVDCTDWACEGKTLLEVLKTGGGGEKALGRHAVAALLNTAAGSGVSYEYSVGQVIAKVQEAYSTGNFEVIKDLFAGQNELGCPLN